MIKKISRNIVAGVILLLVLLGGYLLLLKLTGNVHTVIPNQVYRSEHIGLPHLQRLIQSKHIQTVLDLAPIDNLTQERLLVQKDHDQYIYFPMHAMGVTNKSTLAKLSVILMAAKRPLLIHCKAGADRTGLASALVLILEGYPANKAKQQIELVRDGIMNVHSTGRATLFPYFNWLDQRRYQSSQKHFLTWLEG